MGFANAWFALPIALDTVVTATQMALVSGAEVMLNNQPGDPSSEMYKQATFGAVDFITGDYLAGETILEI